ncbi:EGF domain-specific O-linked N-acetylglucosamine transferase isoform X1 [Diabrotica undecimpunctata]|uniref:EGF domain-specific O-linked N-acetylglucosamine transferase isoform X1 n=1 Tax=Diabrotica undecimpunctata TaxID=50387 RepID=UPI003B63947D
MSTIFLLAVLFVQVYCDTNFNNINLPEEHLAYYFRNFPKVAEQCSRSNSCSFKKYLNKDVCWGYEYDCDWSKQYLKPYCPGDHKGWVKTKHAQETTFHAQADFGYVKQQLREMKLVCEPLFQDDSSLECSEHLRFCRGRNLMINFTKLANREEPIRYKMDVLGEGDIGGYCNLRQAWLDEQADQISPLQSWGPELRYFKQLDHRPINEGDCDVVIEKPTFILKIDATVNMYHHFCDFFNLYASLHLNATQEDAFSTNVHILIWESFTYRSAFQDTWEAFTDHQLWDLKTFKGKTVCFKNVVFPLLPRMIYGLYYNTPIIYGCEKSGLVDAFSKHVLHRLRIPEYTRTNKKIRITFLSRETKFRRILNERELVDALKQNENYDVQLVVFSRDVPFKKQLEIARNSDVFVGIHGAGLTHLLFLPEWASVFEVYNCQDSNCYFDLARLKGVKYFTWENTSKLTSITEGSYSGGSPAKFVNYKMDKTEFVRIINKAAEHVRSHPKYQEHLENSPADAEDLSNVTDTDKLHEEL